LTINGNQVTIPKAIMWSFVVMFLAGVVSFAGGAFWLGALSERVTTIEKSDDTIKAIQTNLADVRDRLARIEATLQYALGGDQRKTGRSDK
jgi:hypothetical protein